MPGQGQANLGLGLMPQNPELGWLRQENHEFEDNLGHTVRPCFKGSSNLVNQKFVSDKSPLNYIYQYLVSKFVGR